MSYRLFVRPESPGGEVDSVLYSWVLLDASGEAQAQGEGDSREHIEHTLGQNALENVHLIGLIPGDEALLCFADIPVIIERTLTATEVVPADSFDTIFAKDAEARRRAREQISLLAV